MTEAVVALVVVVVVVCAALACIPLPGIVASGLRDHPTCAGIDRPTVELDDATVADLMRHPSEWVREARSAVVDDMNQANRDVEDQTAQRHFRFSEGGIYDGDRAWRREQWRRRLDSCHAEGWHPDRLTPGYTEHQWLIDRIDRKDT